MEQAGLQRFLRTHGLALEQERHGRLQAEQACHARGATPRRQQSHLNLGQSELQAAVIRGHPVMAGQTHFEASAQRQTVEGTGDGFAAGFERPQQAVERVGLLHHVRGGTALVVVETGLDVEQVGTGKERLLAGGDDGPADGVVLADAGDDASEFVDENGVDGVHRLALPVERDERDAVRIDGKAQRLEDHRGTFDGGGQDDECRGIAGSAHDQPQATRSMMVAVPMPAPTQRLTSAVP